MILGPCSRETLAAEYRAKRDSHHATSQAYLWLADNIMMLSRTEIEAHDSQSIRLWTERDRYNAIICGELTRALRRVYG